MTMVHYTATVKADTLIELPEEAKELHLTPGQVIEIQFDNTSANTHNTGMLAALDEIAKRQEQRRHTDGSQTDRIIREGRSGAMYGHDPA